MAHHLFSDRNRNMDDGHHGYGSYDAAAGASATARYAYTSYSQATEPQSSGNISSTLRPRSQFTYKHLAQMVSYSNTTPLRVIAHVDLDAFYAQCEQVRLGLPADTPLAVQQWGGLIAINYPARARGLTRFINLADARRLCPELVCQHVATWKEGESGWAYRDNAALNMGTQKVSLDPYRAQSRRILACIKNTLAPGKLQRVEKASVDEVFMDLSAQVHEELLKRYPEELKGPPPYDDPTESLPRPPTTALNWQTDALVDLDAEETEEDDPDWDDIVMLIASEIVRDVRAAVREEVQYTCSAGVARNKMLAKLGSGYNKPNRQTVIRNRAIAHFMCDMKFTKIRNLGGKLGDEIVAAFGTDSVKDLLNVSLEQLRRQLGDDTGTWLYQIVRGEDDSEVTACTQIKSMLSAKSFRPTISSIEVARRWLRIFVGDIFSRLVDDGLLEKRRRPRTLNLHHRQVSQMRSRQAPIPVGRPLDEGVLFEIAKTLLVQVVADGRAWPCSNLSLSVGGFEEVAVAGNRGIGGFLVRGEEAAALAKGGGSSISNGKDKEESREMGAGIESPLLPPAEKRRRTTSGSYSIDRAGNQQSSGIARFFSASREASRGDDEDVDDMEMGGEGTTGWGSDGGILRHQDSLDSLNGNDGLEQQQQKYQHFAQSRSSSSLKRKSSDLKEDDDERGNLDYDLESDRSKPFYDEKNINVNNETANGHMNFDRKNNTNNNTNTRRTTTTSTKNNNNNTIIDDPWSTPPSAQPPPRQDTSSFEKQSSPSSSSPPTKTMTEISKPTEKTKLKSSSSTSLSTTAADSNKRKPATAENPRPTSRSRSSTAGRPLQPSTSTLNRSKTYFDGKPLRDASTTTTATAAALAATNKSVDNNNNKTPHKIATPDENRNQNRNQTKTKNDNCSSYYTCPRCSQSIPIPIPIPIRFVSNSPPSSDSNSAVAAAIANAKTEHEDWHLAMDLQDQEDRQQQQQQQQRETFREADAAAAPTTTASPNPDLDPDPNTATTKTKEYKNPSGRPGQDRGPAKSPVPGRGSRGRGSRGSRGSRGRGKGRGRPPGSTNAATAAAAARAGRGQMRLGFGP